MSAKAPGAAQFPAAPGQGAVPASPSFVELLNQLGASSPGRPGAPARAPEPIDDPRGLATGSPVRAPATKPELTAPERPASTPRHEPPAAPWAQADGAIPNAAPRARPATGNATGPTGGAAPGPPPLAATPPAPSSRAPVAGHAARALLRLFAGPPAAAEAPTGPPEPAEPGRRAAETWNGRTALTSGLSNRSADERPQSAPPRPAPGQAADSSLIDAMSRDGEAIRARMAADGTWHARFRSPDGPIAVRIARQRDGVLAVTIRGPREALARLDGADMANVLQRPIRLVQQPLDPSPAAL